MVAEQEVSGLEFSGTKKIKGLAARAYELMRAQGMFMSENSPITVSLESLTAFLVDNEGAKPADVITALKENATVFAVETRDDVTVVITTRDGRPPVDQQAGVSHSFRERFLRPEAKPERPPQAIRERAKVDPNWATFSVPDYVDEDEEADLDAVVASQPAEVVDEDIQVQVIIEPVEVPAATPVDEPAMTEAAAVTEEPVVEHVEEPVEAAPDQAVTPEAPPAAAPVDLSGVDDAAIAAAIETQLGSDVRTAHFAGQWMIEERVPRLSRGDLRRAKEYIQEQEQPLTDATLVQDILGVRPNSVEFELMQFAVNFRLSKEHRDFDFVGTNDQRFWTTSSLPQIGTTRRKPNEIGTDYRFLIDEAGDVEYRSVTSVDHVLSFYEFSLGLLPYNDELKRLFAKPVSDTQRSAVLTFEIPQSYTTYLVELRYPTPNRGGFLLGLDDFYAENLVPGAMLSISATENDGHYKVEFLAGQDQNARLLELDDRRSPRYLFRPTTYHCEVAPEWLISEDRFPKLGSEKPLDDRTRRRPDAVVAVTFERVGIEDGDAYVATFEDLLAAVNIERPFSENLLRTTLEQDSRVSDDGSDTYTYVPGS
jgi:hypothetical protein